MRTFKKDDTINIKGQEVPIIVKTFTDEINLDYEVLMKEGIILDDEVYESDTFEIQPFSLGFMPTETRTYGVIRI